MKPEESQPKEEVKDPTEREGEREESEDENSEEEEDEIFSNNKNADLDHEENPMDVCEPFSIVEAKMEVNEKEHIDPSRYVIVVENQKKKRRKVKEKLRTRAKKKCGGDGESYDSKKKRQRKQDNPKKKSKKNFVCDICREDLGNEDELNSHRRMRHINEKSEFFCDFCLKIFKTKAILKGHRYKHITDPQFLCVRCGKKYFTISNLNEHSLYCLDEKKFECPVCNKKFNVNKQFKRHLVIHEADRYIKCTVCEQTFSRKDNYRQHFRRHTGEKPYTCDICGKSFRIKATYNYHRRTHRDVRPGDLENLKTESATDSDYNLYRTPSKPLAQDQEFFCSRSESDGDFIRIPRREGEYGYSQKDGSIIPEYNVKREPSEVEYNRKECGGLENNFLRDVRKDGVKEQKAEGHDFSHRINVDYMTSDVGGGVEGDFPKRDPSRLPTEYFNQRKDEFSSREITPQEYLSRRIVDDGYQPRGGGPDFSTRRDAIEPEYNSYANAKAREAPE